MEHSIHIASAKFSIGERVNHALLEYRGLVMDVDPFFQHKESLSQEVLKSLPPKEQPWYHVLVHGTQQVTYVAEQALRLDRSDDDFEHPVMEILFKRDDAGHYQRRFHLQ